MGLQDDKLTIHITLRLDAKSHRKKVEALVRKYKTCGKINENEVLLTVRVARCEQENIKTKLKKYFLRLQPLELRAMCLDKDVWPMWHATGKRGKQGVEFVRFHVHGHFSPPNARYYR